MPRNEMQRLPLDPSSLHTMRRYSSILTQLSTAELLVTPDISGDYAEGCTPHWETAWIDLGGEG